MCVVIMQARLAVDLLHSMLSAFDGCPSPALVPESRIDLWCLSLACWWYALVSSSSGEHLSLLLFAGFRA